MVLKPSREAACPGSFAKKIWKSKQPLSHWPYNQVSKSFFFSFLFHIRKNMFLLQEKKHQNLDGSLNWESGFWAPVLTLLWMGHILTFLWTSVSPSVSSSSSIVKSFWVPSHSACWPLPTCVSWPQSILEAKCQRYGWASEILLVGLILHSS